MRVQGMGVRRVESIFASIAMFLRMRLCTIVRGVCVGRWRRRWKGE